MTDRLQERLHSEQGLAGASLIIVIAWALAAVLMLTGTLIAAQSIDERVFEIRNIVGAIGEDGTQHIVLTQDINRSASGILDAAAPLSGQLDEVISAAGSIDNTVTSILDTAGSINQVAAGQINPNVLAIGTSGAGIGASVEQIHGSFAALAPVVFSINEGVADINRRADVVLAAVNGIKADTGNIVREVGTANVPSIRGHARSIDCNTLVVVLGILSSGGRDC